MNTSKTVAITPEILGYVVDQVRPPDASQEDLIARTQALGTPARMQVPHEQAVLLTLLGKAIRAKTIVEVGTFTGYSTLALARGLVPGGRVVTCDVSSDWVDIASDAWTNAGVRHLIDAKLGPAVQTLRALPEDISVDLAFIDADKTGYLDYWELLVPLVRPGGLILADNALYAGEAASPEAVGNGAAIRDFNAHVRADDRVDSVLVTIADGLLIAVKKERTAQVNWSPIVGLGN